jgi:hypothetical protein
MRQKLIGFEAMSLSSGLNLLGQHRAAFTAVHGNEDRPSVARSFTGDGGKGATRGASQMKLRSKETRRG